MNAPVVVGATAVEAGGGAVAGAPPKLNPSLSATELLTCVEKVAVSLTGKCGVSQEPQTVNEMGTDPRQFLHFHLFSVYFCMLGNAAQPPTSIRDFLGSALLGSWLLPPASTSMPPSVVNWLTYVNLLRIVVSFFQRNSQFRFELFRQVRMTRLSCFIVVGYKQKSMGQWCWGWQPFVGSKYIWSFYVIGIGFHRRK